MKTFKTPEYSGIWLEFNEDRMNFRELIQNHLRKEFSDVEGKLTVGEDGPRWQGSTPVQLSYSHTKGVGVLVYSTTHELGVDIESVDREFKTDLMKLASRFYPPVETEALLKLPAPEQKKQFLKLWVQKEAYAKLTRMGLAKTLELGIIPSAILTPSHLPISPVGILSCILINK